MSAGLLVRFVPLGLPPILTKCGGSTLWAFMIYWIVSTLSGSFRLGGSGSLAALLVTSIEFLKLLHSPSLDAFRLTLPGVLLLGRFFCMRDLVAYGLGITAGILMDRQIRSGQRGLRI
jgi:hypothetical protein